MPENAFYRSLVVVFLCSVVKSSSVEIFEDVSQGTPTVFSDETIRKFVKNMQRINHIQKMIMGVEEEDNVSNGLPADSVPQFPTVAEKPDEIPYLFEGDLILTDDQVEVVVESLEDQFWARKGDYKRRYTRSVTSNLAARWTQFPIPYYINTATGVSSAAVEAGIAKWQAETCITFSRQSFRQSWGNGLEFILGNGCYSYIGRVGNSPQQVSIGYGCTSLGTVTHEIGHALGLYHEQARYDRDDYVRILTQNIQSTYLSQFSKQSRSAMVDYGVGYDMGSVMHYEQTAFTSNGGITIATLDQNYQATIGQRVAPSFFDVKRINFAYCNSTCPTKLDCQNSGYTDPKNCGTCRCPTAFGGNYCQQAAGNPSACGAGDRLASSSLQTITASGSLQCNYVIRAPANKRIFFQITSMSFSRQAPCTVSYVEVKYGSNMGRVGARFCTSSPTISLSATNVLAVIYNGQSNTRFSMNYRYDPPDGTNTDETTTTTTAKTTTTTTKQTTTTKPVPVTEPPPSTTTTVKTTTEPVTTTTTIATPMTTRPTPKTTRATPRTTRRTPPPKTTKRTVRTTTRRPTTRAIRTTTKKPVPPPPKCTAWTRCSAKCGGCGKRTRRCNGKVQRQFCNMKPCQGGYCCRPFFYQRNKTCARPRASDLPGAHRSSSLSQEVEDKSIEVEDYDISKKEDLENTENNEIPEDAGIHENDEKQEIPENQENSQKIQEHSESSQENSESQNVQENSEETTRSPGSVENSTTPETSIEEPQLDASGVPA